MAGSQRLAFRDVGHFYPPLYQFIGESGSFLPLWNPYDHTGIPIAGETTTALFYPLRAIFSLGLPNSAAIGWYVAIHFLLAIAGAAGVARTLGCGKEASLVAGIAYAFSGPVLFLYCNPPFLVGAAWLPFALGGALRLLDGWSAAALVSASIGLAMCTLGGDPQTTVHVGMIVGGTLLWRQLTYRRFARATRPASMVDSAIGEQRSDGDKAAARRPRWLPVSLAAVLAGMLAAPQIVAALDWSRHSARRYEPSPGVSRLLADPVVESEQRWWQPPQDDSHAANIYKFSVAPWHWFDVFIPRLCGDLFPTYERLSALLPGDGRVWAITLYLGVVPLLAIPVRYLRLPRRPFRDRFDVWDALIPVGVLLSLGTFGPVWCWKTILNGLGITALDSVDEALFSPYWTAVTTIPGYSAFRYPGKWLPFVMLGCSVATARSLSQFDEATRMRMQRAAIGLGGIGIIVALAAGLFLLWPDKLQTLIANVPPDSFWGPLAVESALRSVLVSALHVVVFALAAAYLCNTRRVRAASLRTMALGGLLCFDLLLVGYGQVATIDRLAEQQLLDRLAEVEDPPQPSHRLLRTRVGRGWPTAWSRGSNPNRLLEVETSGRHVLFGRWHLERSLGMLNSATSIVPQRTQTLWRAAEEQVKNLPAEQRTAFWETTARVLAVDGFLSRTQRGVEITDTDGQRLVFADRRIWIIDDRLQKVRWHDRWETVPPERYVSKQAWEKVLGRWYRDAEQYLPIVESNDPSDRDMSIAAEDSAAPTSDASIRIGESSRGEVMLEVVAPRRGLLLLSQYQDGNWDAHMRQDQQAWQRVAVHPVDYLSQGIILPKGHWQVRVRYRPPWLVPSLLISCTSMLLIAIAYRSIRTRRGF